MIYNVVVAMEYAASVRACLDRFIDAFLCRMNCQDVNRPFGVALCDAGTLVGDINFSASNGQFSFALQPSMQRSAAPSGAQASLKK